MAVPAGSLCRGGGQFSLISLICDGLMTARQCILPAGLGQDRPLLVTDRGEGGIIGQGGERTGRVIRGATAVSVAAALSPQWPVPELSRRE